MESLEGYRERLFQALRDAVGGTVAQREALLELLALGVSRSSELDEPTRSLLERVGTLVMGQITGAVNTLPPSPEQRTLRRSLDLARGIHYSAADLLAAQERPPAESPPFAQDADAVCLAILQEVADLVHDVNQVVKQGNPILAFAGLITECIQESLFGLHAARHGFPGQVLAHCRAIYEDLDLLALFRKQPEWVDVWLSAENERIWRDLRPAAVRQKLGRDKRDIPYSFYSELGTHTSILSVSARSRFLPGQGTENPRLVILVTGTVTRDELLPAYAALSFQLHHLLLESIGWSQHLKTGLDENWNRLRRTTEQHATFFKKHVVPWMKERGFPDATIRGLLRSLDHPDA